MDATIEQQFWSRVDKSDPEGCWPWTGGHDGGGYGTFGRHGRAHRVAYEIVVGPIPAGLTIDHLCRNRGCANPAHMEAVTRGENVRRGVRFRVYARSMFCPRGHDRAIVGDASGGGCPECHRQTSLARYYRTHIPKPKRVITHCVHGHERTPENITTHGTCRVCHRIRSLDWANRNKHRRKHL